MSKSEIEFANEQINKMSELIDRTALRLRHTPNTSNTGGNNTLWYYSYEDVQNAPAVDAVEVVRCGDCKWADPCICVVCEEGKTVVCGKFHMHANKDGFCSYGERKEVTHEET